MEVVIVANKAEVIIEKEKKDLQFETPYSVYIEGDIYDGEYEVTPKTNPQTLETATKVMLQDVLINKIPYYETSNEYGDTIYIGSEV